jgi:hypothetical protein
MIYIFYFFCFISGAFTLLSGVRCFTEKGKKKLIKSKQNAVDSLQYYGSFMWNSLGLISVSLGLLFMGFSINFFVGA